MLTITQNQALQRWDTLPDILREALYAEANSDFLWKACENENVPGEKIHDVARIAGYVLLGFMHPADMAEELKEGLNLDPKTCTAVSSAIDARIFAPLRSDIDKTYEPLSKFAGAPKIIQDIGPMPAATTPAQTVPPAVSAVATPSPLTPPPMKPKVPEVGWSKLTPEAPVVRLSQTSVPPQPPATPAAAPVKGPADEFERIAVQQQKPAEPAPIIIHEDVHVQPIQKSADFRLVKPGDTAAVMPGANTPKPQPPLKPAVLELGQAVPPAPPAVPKPATSPTPARVVHYTDYKAPPAPQGTRQVTEVTSPPTPPTPPQNKIVYKDYSEPQAPPQTPKMPPPVAPAPPPPPPPIKK